MSLPKIHRVLPSYKHVYNQSTSQKKLNIYTLSTSGSGGSVGMATGYGMDGPRIESRWGRDFPHLSRPALGPTSLL
jgi:hypothetical protein